MGKWLHRGFVAGSMGVVIAAVVAIVADPTWELWEHGNREREVHLQITDRSLNYLGAQLFCDPDAKEKLWEFECAHLLVRHIVAKTSGGCIVRKSEFIGRENEFGDLLEINVPLWLVVVIVSPFPCVAIYRSGRTRRRRRLADTACLQCGYDLTANVSGICPECGTALEASA